MTPSWSSIGIDWRGLARGHHLRDPHVVFSVANVEYMEAAFAATGRGVVVVDPQEVKDDLVQDMIGVLTSMCARLYGRRSARNRAEKALKAASEG